MKKKIRNTVSLWLVIFIAGLAAWNFFSKTQVFVAQEVETIVGGLDNDHNSLIVQVGEERIESFDVLFEQRLLQVAKVADADDVEVQGDEEWTFAPEAEHALRQEVLTGLVERKTLFSIVREDRTFDYESPQRYTACLSDWQQSVKEAKNLFKEPMDRERLKKLLCEKGLIQQYLTEKVFAKVQVSEQEVDEYYKMHHNEFNQPERVVLRQIHLVDEKLARQLRPGLNKANFAKLAEENSVSPESAQGGLMKPFSRGELPGVFDYALSMKQGEISDVLQSPYGFHIFLVEAKVKEMEATPELAEAKIRQILLQKKQEEEYDLWVNMATKRISIIPASSAL